MKYNALFQTDFFDFFPENATLDEAANYEIVMFSVTSKAVKN